MKKTKKMKPWAFDCGLTPMGAEVAERSLVHALALLRSCGHDVDLAKIALHEMYFRVVVLPERTIPFQRRYQRENF